MDSLCEESLFAKRRRVRNGFVTVFPYAKSRFNEEEELSVELQWSTDVSTPAKVFPVITRVDIDHDELAQASDGAEECGSEEDSGDEEGDLERINTDLETDQSTSDESREQSVDSEEERHDSPKIPLTAPQPLRRRNIGDNKLDIEPVPTRPSERRRSRSSRPRKVKRSIEGIIPAKAANLFQCLYCLNDHGDSARRQFTASLVHRAVCLNNPNKSRHHEEYMDAFPGSKRPGPFSKKNSQKSDAILLDIRELEASEIKHEESKVTEDLHSVETNLEDEEILTEDDISDDRDTILEHGQTDLLPSPPLSNQDTKPRSSLPSSTFPPKKQNKYKYSLYIGPRGYICRQCYENSEPLKAYKGKGWVRRHWLTCKYNQSTGSFFSRVPTKAKRSLRKAPPPPRERLNEKSGEGR